MSNTFQSSHGRISYTDSGAGTPPLILMHGLPTAKELFAPVLPHLESSFRVIAFDLNDYGQSEKIGRHISHRQRADVLDELRAHLGLDRFTLVSHDLGASVAIDYMGRLVLMSPPVYPDFDEPVLVKLTRLPGVGPLLIRLAVERLLRSGIKRGMVHKARYTPAFHQALRAAFTGPDGRAALWRILRWGRPRQVFADYPHIIRAIQVPTLVIQGRRDPYIPASQAERLARDISGAELVWIDDGSHFLPLDTPEPVAQAINAFILRTS
jgi:2-hydroxymuconate-semialdehyde hydrolase